MKEPAPNLITRAAARLRQAASPPTAPTETLEDRAAEASDVPDVAAAHRAAAAKKAVLEPPRRSEIVTIDRGALARAGVIMPNAQRTRTSEEFRIVKRQVVAEALREPDVDAGGRNGRLIMVTSSRPREGKTFTAVNLAFSLASERDFKVLLIDADVHRQSLVELFGVKAEKGWVNLLADSSVEFSDVLLRTNVPNLSLLPSGKGMPGVPELLSSKRMGVLVNEMVQRYPDRFIIFDAPPCLASSEPSILAGYVGQIVFVVESHRTRREEVESALHLISACGNIFLLLNKTENFLTDDFGAYADYYVPEK